MMPILNQRAVCLMFAVMVACLANHAAAAEEKPSPPAPPETLNDATFGEVFDALQPPKVEPWKSIPWHISIVEAAQQAQKQGKPVFMWQADGWPLGCG